MTTKFRYIVPILGFVLGTAAAVPLAFAGPAPTANKAETMPPAHDTMKGPATNYDGFDRFRDPAGNPLPGWEYLFISPG